MTRTLIPAVLALMVTAAPATAQPQKPTDSAKPTTTPKPATAEPPSKFKGVTASPVPPKPPAPAADPLPDLAIASIAIDEGKGRVKVTVVNKQAGKAKNFQVRTQVLCTGKFGGTGDEQTKTVGELKGNDDRQLTFDVDFADIRKKFPGGALVVRAVADSGNTVKETNEEKNQLEQPVPPPPLPDLKVSKPELAQVGDRIEVKVRVDNAGDAKAEQVKVRLRVIAFPDSDGETVFETIDKTIDKVKAGDDKTATVKLNLADLQARFVKLNQTGARGKLVLRATVDPDGKIGEKDDRNNSVDHDITPK